MSKKVLSIQEIEARNAEKPNFGSGIQLAGGFDLGAKAPLDSRDTVKTIAERDAHVTGNRAYEGMLVYVEADELTYQLRSGKWEVFGFNQDDFQAQVVDNLTTDDATKALSARQGKVLNEKITAEAGRIDSLETEMSAVEGRLDTVEGDITTINGKVSAVEGRLDVVEPKVTAVEEGLAQEIEDRQAADAVIEGKITEVKGDIATETAARIAGDAALEAKDTELLGKINKEVSDRTEAVAAVDAKVTANAEAIAKEVTDRKAAITATEGKITTALTDAKAYTDAEIVKVNATVTGVQGEVDALEVRVGANETAIAGIPAQISTAKSEAIAGAKTYTDAEIVKVNKAITDGDAATLQAAKTYADSKDAEGLVAAKAYADTKVGELKDQITNPVAGEELDAKFKNVVVAGDLEVKGTVTSVETTELNVENAIIEVNSKGADLTESDVHLGLRANLGGEAYSNLVYCTDLGKWIVHDTHPVNLAKEGKASHEPIVRTIAYVEDMEASNAELAGKVDAVEGRLDVVEPKVDALESGMTEVEGRLDAIEAVEAVVEQITVPSNVINLAKLPSGKVEVLVNGILYVEGFTVAGQVVTWLEEDFAIESDDKVVVKYSTIK